MRRHNVKIPSHEGHLSSPRSLSARCPMNAEWRIRGLAEIEVEREGTYMRERVQPITEALAFSDWPDVVFSGQDRPILKYNRSAEKEAQWQPGDQEQGVTKFAAGDEWRD